MRANDNVQNFGKLLMRKNDKEAKVMHDKIDLDKKYCLRVSLPVTTMFKHHKIQLLQD